MRRLPSIIRRAGALVAMALSASTASAAVVEIHEFDTTAQDWEVAGDMATVEHDAFGGGSLRGDFDSQGMFFTPTTGSFRQETDPAFLGTYPGAEKITGFSFDFYADSVAPIDLNLRLFSGLEVYFITLNIAGRTWGDWENFVVALADPYWQGDANILNTVTAIEVQVARGSADEQTFYLDNFQTLNSEIDPDPDPGGGGLVPEPSTIMMLLNAGLLLAVLRRQSMRKIPAPKEAT